MGYIHTISYDHGPLQYVITYVTAKLPGYRLGVLFNDFILPNVWGVDNQKRRRTVNERRCNWYI